MMNKLKKLVLLILLVALESCYCDLKDDRGRLETLYEIQFRLYDKDTDESLFGFGAKYNLDSVLVYDAIGVLFTQGLYQEMAG